VTKKQQTTKSGVTEDERRGNNLKFLACILVRKFSFKKRGKEAKNQN